MYMIMVHCRCDWDSTSDGLSTSLQFEAHFGMEQKLSQPSENQSGRPSEDGGYLTAAPILN